MSSHVVSEQQPITPSPISKAVEAIKHRDYPALAVAVLDIARLVAQQDGSPFIPPLLMTAGRLANHKAYLPHAIDAVTTAARCAPPGSHLEQLAVTRWSDLRQGLSVEHRVGGAIFVAGLLDVSTSALAQRAVREIFKDMAALPDSKARVDAAKFLANTGFLQPGQENPKPIEVIRARAVRRILNYLPDLPDQPTQFAAAQTALCRAPPDSLLARMAQQRLEASRPVVTATPLAQDNPPAPH